MLNYSKSSLLAKFWCWFYVKEQRNLPRSICPYFWKYVLLIITFIPVMIITIPCILVELIWPDFKEDDFEKAILEYQKRERRFGGIDADKKNI